MAATSTVTVACKIPNGIILRGGSFVSVNTPVLGGGMREEKQWRPSGQNVTINGPKRAMESGDPESPIADGYALTFGVPADLMERWMDENKDSDMVLNGLIRYAGSRSDLKDMTKEGRDAKTGLEPMSQTRDPRIPRANIEKMVA